MKISLVLALILGLPGFVLLVPDPAGADSRPNVILLSIDTLRADRLGCYGGHPEVSPHIDAFAEESVLFRRCASTAPSTLPSHASVFTSLYPSQHRANCATRTPLRSDVATWAEILGDAGYRTASFNGGAQLLPEYGTDRGFETYLSLRAIEENMGNDGLLKNAERATGWMEGIGDAPFFLFLHTYDVHMPYTPPDKYRRFFAGDYRGILPRQLFFKHLELINGDGFTVQPEDHDYIVALSNAEVRYADDTLGEFFDYLKRTDRWENTLFILMSDHGDDFGERGLYGFHAHSLHKETIDVPLIIKFPRGRDGGRVIESQVSLLDLLPTLVHFLDLEVPREDARRFEGRTLLPLLEEDTRAEVRVFSEKEREDAERGALGTAMLTNRYRVIRDHDEETGWEYEIYDRKNDPSETRNYYTEGLEPWDALRADLDAWADSQLEDLPEDSAPVAIPEEGLEQMRALGYVGG